MILPQVPRRAFVIGCALLVVSTTPVQATWGALGRAVAAYLGTEAGAGIATAIGSGDRDEIVGTLSKEVGGRVIFGQNADVGILLAGNGLADLGRAVDRYLQGPPDTRPLIERSMSEVGLTYGNLDFGIDIRAPGGDLEFQIALYNEVIDRLQERAVAAGESFVGAGTLQQELLGLEAQLAALRSGAPQPIPQPLAPAPVPQAAPAAPAVATPSVADLVTNGRWAMDPGGRLPGGLRGAYMCETDGPPRGHCFIVGCGSENVGLDFFMIAPSMTDHGHREGVMRVDGGGGISMEFTAVPIAPDLYYGTFPASDGQVLLERLQSGSWTQLTFQTDVAIFTYSSGLAGSSRAIGEAARICAPQTVSSPAEAVALFVIGQVCDGRGGQIDGRGLFQADLDRNGRLDIIVDENAISCNGSGSRGQIRPLSCGAQFCDFQVFLDQDGNFNQSLVAHGTVTGVGTAREPIVDTIVHGGDRVRYQWNGSGFSRF
jgi:hypothetical protein